MRATAQLLPRPAQVRRAPDPSVTAAGRPGHAPLTPRTNAGALVTADGGSRSTPAAFAPAAVKPGADAGSLCSARGAIRHAPGEFRSARGLVCPAARSSVAAAG